MSSYRKIYNQIGVFISSCPSTGYHFLDFNGNPINSIYSIFSGGSTGYSYNLINPLNRIVQASYGFSESRNDIKSFGNLGTLSRPIITTPLIDLSLSYYGMGICNEQRLGLLCNYITGNSLSLYPTNICPIVSLFDRTNIDSQVPRFKNYSGNSINWLKSNRDGKNIFIATNDNNDDFNFINPVTQTLNGTTGTTIKDSIHIYAFGDCYLDSYKFSASIGQIPQANVNFTCHNIMYYDAGSGNNTPSINPKDLTLRSGISYSLPSFYTGTQATVLLPGDITMNISEYNGNGNFLKNLPIDFTDIKVQSFSLDLSLNREALNNLGYKLPLDRRINLPIYANLSISAIVGDLETGSFTDFLNRDISYNVLINMNFSKNQPFTGTAILYQFLGCKFNSISLSESINEKRMLQLSVISEVIPNNNDIGFFISGHLGINQENKPIY